MNPKAYHAVEITARTHRWWKNGVRVHASNHLTLDILRQQIVGLAPHGQLDVQDSQVIWVSHLGDLEFLLARQIRDYLVATGWELVADTPEEHTWYMTLWRSIAADPVGVVVQTAPLPEIVDRLDSLVDLHKRGELTDSEFEAAKHKLLGM